MKITLSLLITIVATIFPLLSIASSPILAPAWTTATEFNQPESVVYDQAQQILYVSNINGDGTAHDGDGFISQLALNGTVIKKKWITGLDAPKGMAIVGNKLYVADIDQLVIIDITSAKISQRYPAPGAIFLNDVAADNKGNIYVSDMMTNTIHQLANDKFDIWLHDIRLEAPNGLLVKDDQLIVGSWGNITNGFSTDIPGHLKIVDLNSKQIQSLGDKTPAGNLDGVEADGNGNYLVTDWMAGKLLHITPEGISTTLLVLDQGAADHAVLLEHGLVIIPIMLSDKVVAYKILEPTN